ncbi:MAG TPA: type I restriction endonuclease subunit R [Chlorobiota bacterium]|nr:type I restriction endonuclease subunit R [Chlorobiota bacterium]
MSLTESIVEDAALKWFGELGYAVKHGPDIAPGEPAAERDEFSEVLLRVRLHDALRRLNPGLAAEALEDATTKVLRVTQPALARTNRAFHTMLREGVPVEYKRADGTIAGDHALLVDYDNPANNDWLVVNQFTVIEHHKNRRPDVVVFVNGIPLAVIELKNAADEKATIDKAYLQLQTYKAEIPSLLQYNEVLVVSDGTLARIGSLTAGKEWFKVWRTIDGRGVEPPTSLELETLIKGVFEKRRFLDLIRYGIVFEEDADSDKVHKIVAGYHQFHAVEQAVHETVRASSVTQSGVARDVLGTYHTSAMKDGKPGDHRIGVVWHTQGSGKSFSMLFYAARIARHPAMQNPTIVVLTDRNDLDDQLFGQFQRCHEHLGQMPKQAESVANLRELLAVASGGVIFTTIQKFKPDAKGEKMPLLSSRANIVVMADEAHRSQYDLIDGLARNLRDALPNASFIGFTGTPIETTDANTRAIFGDYISVYDIQRAVADNATVPIYYESRIAKLKLNEQVMPTIDDDFEEITETEEVDHKERLKTRWAALEAMVGDSDRLALVAKDLVEHYERRDEAMTGKAMVVCMSRRICVDLYNQIIALRPEWAGSTDDNETDEEKKSCVVKVIMTGSADDGPEWQQHIRNKERRGKLALRFKDAKDPFRIVIVRDMWLTGFDAPCLTTMYVDKPMRGHGLMQAIARVNRVFKDKPGGLVVDYLGLAEPLKHALKTYTESGGIGTPSIDMDQAIRALEEKYDVASGIMHGFDWSVWHNGIGTEKLKLIPSAMEHVLAQADGKKRFVAVVRDLSRAFALCATSAVANELRSDIAFFQAVQASLSKSASPSGRDPDDIDAAVRQLVDRAIAPDGEMIDVFTAAGLKKPDISILSDSFLAEVRGLKHKHVAAELLAKLLKGEIKIKSDRNIVEGRKFSDMLQKTLNQYHNRAIATAEIIEELIKLAEEIRAAKERGEKLGLNDDELAFYDALGENTSAIELMGDDKLKVIATELVTQVRKNVTIDWNLRTQARAKIKVLVKRILRKHGYPPDLQDAATQLVLRQAEVLCAGWV